MQNMALRRIVGAYRTTPIAVLQKEAGIMPYSIRLKFMVARKAIRLHLNISKTNPINGHLLTLIEKSPIAKLTTLYMLAKDDRDYMIKKDEKRKCKRVEPLTLKQQQNQTIGILKKQAMEEWQEMYWNSSKDLWYHNITVESKCTDNLSKMVTGVIMKKDSRRILSNITQFRTGHGNFGAWFKKFGIEKDSYNCKCGELETVHHILVECPLLEEERKGLKRISPEMDMSTLLNSLTGLQEISKNGDEVFTSVKRLNIKNADWEKFDKELSSAIKDFNVHNKTLKSTDQIDDQAKVLEEVVKRAMAKSMKEVKVMKKSKRYWNQELREKLEKALEAKREARQRQPSLALKRQKIEEAKKARKIFDHSLREASTEQWNKYLSSLEGNDIWKILKYINPKSNDTIIPQIRKEDGTLTTTVDEKRHEIWKALLPEIDHGLDREFEIDNDSRWPKLEFDEVDSALADTPNDKAPGDDGITGKVLKMAWLNKDFKERFFKLLQACVKFGYHPKVWRHGIIVVIPKPKKPDYSKPRAYRPISLLKIPSKVLEKLYKKNDQTYNTLTSTRAIWGRQGYCATDAVLELVQRIETSKEKFQLCSLIFKELLIMLTEIYWHTQWRI
ncbi:uncharacterized protein SAPINGB_P000760 [Magnusiomyces paraingens]|uniref:Reverse transcriptase domain-containing protein n=1 Tax=Magnusiomyces paraingens TaxID=2606893 RepID=A0A5E8B2I0_9ASCO|nr:uncharacterized protein SAPINGB_P000760 [Saprochaete ingens]VVT45468.1 unnamed protein product [Saprochaete ingens]